MTTHRGVGGPGVSTRSEHPDDADPDAPVALDGVRPPLRARIAAAVVALVVAVAGFGAAVFVLARLDQANRAVSVTNGRIAFAALGDGTWQIFSVEPDGTDLVQITDVAAPLVVASPAWSPDGSMLAYVVRESDTNRSDIWIARGDGSDAHPITDRGSNWGPSWSPDGSRIAYTHGDYIHVMDADGTNVTNLMPEPTGVGAFDPTWSPDGEFIAFVGRDLDDDLYVMRSDGSDVRPLFVAPGAQREPAWSPDGSTIAFADHSQATESGTGELTLIDPSGNATARLTNLPQVAQAPAWSPDGRQIAFMANVAGEDREAIYVMNADGTDVREIRGLPRSASWPAWQPIPAEEAEPEPSETPAPITTTRGNGAIYYRVEREDGSGRIESIQPDGSGRHVVFDGDPLTVTQVAWSPDGTRIAYRNPVAEASGIYVANPDGTEAIRLTDGANDGWPTWSPDGTKIAFSSTRHDPSVGACTSSGDPNLGCPTDIFVMASDGTDVRRLLARYGSEYQPVWSPDGTRIAFTHMSETWNPTAVYVMDADGTDARQISSQDGGSDFAPSWSPDASQLVFAAIRYEDWGVFVVNADGSGEHEITFEGEFGGWSENRPVWSPDGTSIAAVCTRPDGGDVTELCLIRPDGTGVTSVTEVPHGVVDIAWQPLLAEEPSIRPSPDGEAAGSISALNGARLPEGRLLVQVNDRVEVLEPDSESSTPIAEGVRGVDLSADGNHVLLTAELEDRPEPPLESLDLATGERTLIADAGTWGWPARWSPDGSSIAARVGNAFTLCVYDLEETAARCFPELGRVFEFDWSPDGARIVFEQGLPGSLTILDVRTGQTSILARWDDRAVLDAVDAAGPGKVVDIQFQGPRWSPSERFVAALGMVETDTGWADNVVLVFDMNGSVVVHGVPFGEYSAARDWSPTGDLFAYAAGEPPYQIVDMRVLDASSGEERTVDSTEDTGRGTIRSVAWSPSGRWMAIVTIVGSGGYYGSEIRVIDLSGAEPSRIFTSAGIPELVGWGP